MMLANQIVDRKVLSKSIRGLIISIEKLRKEYKPFEAKRQLIASFELFLADRRILRMLPPLLGKSFFEKKRLPIPVKLPQSPDKVSFLKIIEEASRTTPLYFPSNGRCISIKVATLDMPLEEIEANILTVLSHAIKQIPGGSLNNVQSVHIKSTSSTALPLYSIST
ncbi:hypothetical protein DI09_24p260 [Mitosporidium daphniae]|uniref:Ribosomal protein L1 n=1 Tax=Mitosporidium daphniae TaxID=1485682 RepID=A0A098VSH8_9MICR|nr:uncharacterized protein DI09_24p260 [Mitosporidium daphniae]KGG51905.1 hypothetical protein DI09_24p260 [Mitosporidium daphniae]|eukprot:XP_013238332.1 uncharacterized protein DI09_24p260 [Mitosporidium daphniae]